MGRHRCAKRKPKAKQPVETPVEISEFQTPMWPMTDCTLVKGINLKNLYFSSVTVISLNEQLMLQDGITMGLPHKIIVNVLEKICILYACHFFSNTWMFHLHPINMYCVDVLNISFIVLLYIAVWLLPVIPQCRLNTPHFDTLLGWWHSFIERRNEGLH